MKKLVLIDAHGLIHRAFHALPPLTTPKGEPIGAVYGLATMLLKIIKEHNPDYIAAAFDRPETTHRKKKFAEYKAHRPPTPEELISQFVKSRDLFGIFNIPILDKAGFEADDVIGTLAKRFAGNNISVVILTGDLDTMQLVRDPWIKVEIPKKGVGETVVYDESAVHGRFGVGPEQMTDYKGLIGDPSDNIPGIPGVGPKTAVKAIEQYGTIENIFKKMTADDPLSKKFLPYEKQAMLSKELSIIDKEVPIDAKLEELVFQKPSPEALARHFSELGFESLLSRLGFPKSALSQESLIQSTQKELASNSSKVNYGNVFVARESSDKKLLQSDKVKIAFDWKELLKTFEKNNVTVKNPLFDIHIAAWLINPERKMLTQEEISIFIKTHNESEEEKNFELYSVLKHKLKECGLENIFENVEMPLVQVLEKMELAGIAVNKKKLQELKKKVAEETGELAKKIYAQAKTHFNINSPQQVANILSQNLDIKELKKRKTSGGQLKTGKGILEELIGVHPIILLILEYRENFKILSSFIEPLENLIEKDGRIHTTFLQTGTATGRLSSEKPNIQNIPQESKWSRQLRSAFEARRGWSLLSFDYSQIELRILAHLSEDKELMKAFKEGRDIHTVTASNVFNVPIEKVTKAMRRTAKTLNFGVIYGMGPRSFAKTSGIPLEEAKNAIKEYYSDFPDVKTWQEKTLKRVKETGYAENINGRKRWFDLEHSGRGEYERAAVNMPIQSFEADIIKIAMINTVKILENKNLLGYKIRLLLSIHDELLFEVDDDILKSIASDILEVMESVVKLNVPLKVDISNGKNWGEMEALK
ncbi:MAG: DNA polymerase [Patescibacteria group bacterium]